MDGDGPQCLPSVNFRRLAAVHAALVLPLPKDVTLIKNQAAKRFEYATFSTSGVNFH